MNDIKAQAAEYATKLYNSTPLTNMFGLPLSVTLRGLVESMITLAYIDGQNDAAKRAQERPQLKVVK